MSSASAQVMWYIELPGAGSSIHEPSAMKLVAPGAPGGRLQILDEAGVGCGDFGSLFILAGAPIAGERRFQPFGLGPEPGGRIADRPVDHDFVDRHAAPMIEAVAAGEPRHAVGDQGRVGRAPLREPLGPYKQSRRSQQRSARPVEQGLRQAQGGPFFCRRGN